MSIHVESDGLAFVSDAVLNLEFAAVIEIAASVADSRAPKFDASRTRTLVGAVTKELSIEIFTRLAAGSGETR